VAIIDPATNTVVGAIDSGSTNAHRLVISPDRAAPLHRERGRRRGFRHRPAEPQADGQVQDAAAARRHRDHADGRTVIAGRRCGADPVLIDTTTGQVRTLALEGVPKAAQIARYSEDSGVLGVTSLNSNTVSLIDPSFASQTAIRCRQPADGHGVPRR
jgi:hypothetical protein